VQLNLFKRQHMASVLDAAEAARQLGTQAAGRLDALDKVGKLRSRLACTCQLGFH
jgi:hypothetical protein